MNTEAIMDYFQEYRDKKAQIDILKKNIENHQKEINRITSDARAIAEDLRGMQRIITEMIDSGMDHVEVKMCNDLSSLNNNFWGFNDLPGELAVNTISIPTTTIARPSSILTSVTGTIGATGAIGATRLVDSMFSSVPYSHGGDYLTNNDRISGGTV